MLLGIQHRTELSYSDRVSESVIELRVAPRIDAQQSLRGFGLAIGPFAPVFEYTDWLGSRVHQFSIEDFHDRVIVLAHSAVETAPQAFELEELSSRVPLELSDHRPAEFLRFDKLVILDPRLAELSSALGLRDAVPVGEVIARVMRGVGEKLKYEKGKTTSDASVSDVLDHGAGVCQDFAHVAIALFRRLGIPARYVSGYFFRDQDEQELETHAWCEVWVPERGFIAIDPTHARVVGESHVAIASGRSYADVPPNRGVYQGAAEEKISVSVTIEAIKEVPRGLLAQRPPHLDVPTYQELRRPHHEAIDYQAEQQQQQQQQ